MSQSKKFTIRLISATLLLCAVLVMPQQLRADWHCCTLQGVECCYDGGGDPCDPDEGLCTCMQDSFIYHDPKCGLQ